MEEKLKVINIDKFTELTQEELKRQLYYNPDTGIFTRKVSNNNRVKIGNITSCKDKNGYIKMGINYKEYYAQRLAWLYMEGYFPKGNIKYIDKNRLNNRFDNLSILKPNKKDNKNKLNKNNKSGITGIHWDKNTNKWKGEIIINSKSIYLGRFKKLANAAFAMWKIEIKYKILKKNTDSSAYNYLKKNV